MSVYHVSSLPVLPDWMRYIEGEVPIVLVAPHGGRRPTDAPIRDSVKVNDLHTAEMTAELAARTRSYALINQSLDRNEIDLNRVSQVRTDAPWFPIALVVILSHLLEQYGTAKVFFVHGWNVVQPVCDVGIGLRQKGTRIVPAGKGAPTIGTAFLSEELLPFQAAAAATGLDVALGRRYAAAAKNNFMQVFSPRFAEDESVPIRTLAELSSQEKIHAVQLELGVGLRWPGADRERFIELFCQTLGKPSAPLPQRGRDFSTFILPAENGDASQDRDGAFLPVQHDSHDSNDAAPTRMSLHFHDPVSGLGLMGGIEFDSAASTHSGRLLLSLGGTEMMLFTGEDAASPHADQVRIGSYVWQRNADGLSISYRGTVMRFSHPQAFIRLEDGLAASWIEPVEMHLQLSIPASSIAPSSPIYLARLHGEIRLRDRQSDSDRVSTIDAWGFMDLLRAEEAGRLLPRQLVSLPFGPDLGIFLARIELPEGPRSAGVIYADGTPYPLRPSDWDLQYVHDHGRPVTFDLSLNPNLPNLPNLSSLPNSQDSPERSFSLTCQGETTTAIPVVRHVTEGRALAVTFGLAKTLWQGREARGVYEFSEFLKR
jgi:hypothetical protein